MKRYADGRDVVSDPWRLVDARAARFLELQSRGAHRRCPTVVTVALLPIFSYYRVPRCQVLPAKCASFHADLDDRRTDRANLVHDSIEKSGVEVCLIFRSLPRFLSIPGCQDNQFLLPMAISMARLRCTRERFWNDGEFKGS